MVSPYNFRAFRAVCVFKTFASSAGEVVRIMNFGAFVQLSPNKDGMIHISKLSNERVEKVEDVVNIGDKVAVKVLEIDKMGRINLKLEEKIED